MSSIYPLEPPIFTNPFSQQPARLDPFPSFPVGQPPMRSLEVPVYQDNHLPLPPFNQTPDEHYQVFPVGVGVRANHRDGSVHEKSEDYGVQAFTSTFATKTDTYHISATIHDTSLNSEFPPFHGGPSQREVHGRVSHPHAFVHTRLPWARESPPVDVTVTPAATTSGLPPLSATLAARHDDWKMATSTAAVGVFPTSEMASTEGASPNCTTYANLPPHHLVPERARAREGGTPDPSALSPSQRTRSGRAARNPAASSLKFAVSAHDDASNVLRSASLSTPKTTLVGSLSGSPRKAPPSLPNLPNPNLLGCDTPAADSEPLSSIPTRLDHRQLQHVSNVTKSASNNLSADDGVCHSGHGHVSLPGAVVGVHHPNANVNFISRNASSIQERGKKIYRSGCDAREEERRPALSLTVPSPPPPLHPSVSVLEQAKHREEEDQCLLTAFLCSRSRVLKIIHPTFAQGLPNILQCVSRVTTAMRDSCTLSPIVYTARPASRFPSSPRSFLSSSVASPVSLSPYSTSSRSLSPYPGHGGLKTPEDLLRPKSQLTPELQGDEEEEVYVMYANHEEALHTMDIALSTPSLGLSVSPALEDLHGAKMYVPNVEFKHSASDRAAIYDITATTFLSPEEEEFVFPGKIHDLNLALNSGNSAYLRLKKSSTCNNATDPASRPVKFRVGDWMCTLNECGTHNFSRNMVCYGCGSPRHPQSQIQSQTQAPMSLFPAGPTMPTISLFPLPSATTTTTATTAPVSTTSPSGPRFATAPPPRSYSLPMNSPNGALPSPIPAKPPAPSYPLLTPSGHALASGGRVRNISLDPMNPCVMYWPDNEPLPERGQIRPTGSAVTQYPPIINTGNKGAAEKQPGDWVCSKCNYLNWRRRKVCQTCYPYAEGNGDSISQAVQAERIALLTNVLNQVNDPVSPLPLPLPGHHQAPQIQSGYPGAPPHPSLQRRSSAPINLSHLPQPTHPAHLSHHPPSPFYQPAPLSATTAGFPNGSGLEVSGSRGGMPPIVTTTGRARPPTDMRGLARRPTDPSNTSSFAFPPSIANGNHGQFHLQRQETTQRLHRHSSGTAIYQTQTQTQVPGQNVFGLGIGGMHEQRNFVATGSTRSSRVPSPTSSLGHGLSEEVLAHSSAGRRHEENEGEEGDMNTGVTPSAPSLLPGFLVDLVRSRASQAQTQTHPSSKQLSAGRPCMNEIGHHGKPYGVGNSNACENVSSHPFGNGNVSRIPPTSNSIHSSPSTSTSSWSLDEYEAFDYPSAPAYEYSSIPGYDHASMPAYEYAEGGLFPSQLRGANGRSFGVSSHGNHGHFHDSLPVGGLEGLDGRGQVGGRVGVIGRPPRLGHSSSSPVTNRREGVYESSRSSSSGSPGSAASTPAGREMQSIWRVDGEDEGAVSGTWKPASSMLGGRPGYVNRFVDHDDHGLGGLEDLAARLSMNGEGGMGRNAEAV